MIYLFWYYCLTRNDLLIHCCLNSNVLPMPYKSFQNIFTSRADIIGLHVAFFGQHIYLKFLFLSILSAFTFVGVIFFQGTHFLLQVLLFCCFFEIAFYNILLEWFCLAIGYRKFNRKFFRYFLIAPNDVKALF